MIGDIMAISRLRMATDGQGVSTLVAFYGCPLHCKYCINDSCHGNKHSLCGTIRAAYQPEELVEVLKKDEIYYLMTGGGVVFGGGEPLLQSEFIHEVCQLIGPGWHKRIETSLNVPLQYIKPILKDIDEWIIDIKDANGTIYKAYTGEKILQLRKNLLALKRVIPKERFHIRVPYIPGYNTHEDVEKSVAWIKEFLDVEPEVFDYYVVSPAGR